MLPHLTRVKCCALTTLLQLRQAMLNALELHQMKTVVYVRACVYHPLAVVSHGHDELGLFSRLFSATVLAMVVRSGCCPALIWRHVASSRPLQNAY